MRCSRVGHLAACRHAPSRSARRGRPTCIKPPQAQPGAALTASDFESALAFACRARFKTGPRRSCSQTHDNIFQFCRVDSSHGGTGYRALDLRFQPDRGELLDEVVAHARLCSRAGGVGSAAIVGSWASARSEEKTSGGALVGVTALGNKGAIPKLAF